MKTVSREQALTAMAVLATNIDWSQVDADDLQNNVVLKAVEAGKQATAFLKNGAKMVIAAINFVLNLVASFNPAEFVGSGWSIWLGPADGTGLDGDEDCVPEPDVVDFEQVITETHLQGDETSIPGEEKRLRARAGKNKQLGGRAFLALWNNWLACEKAGKPVEKLYKAGKIGSIVYFFGLTLRNPNGDRYVLSLYRNDDGQWNWHYRWLGFRWYADDPSLALASANVK